MNDISLKSLQTQFIEDLKGKGRSQSTIIAYGKDIEQLIDFVTSLNKTSCTDITIEDLEQFKSNLKKRIIPPKAYLEKSIVLELFLNTWYQQAT
ncbi:MAG: site-specific integrase [Patescibacteria group bacterium]|nr:site-specific integrase [Patescibacteria group bacterium]